MARLPLTRKWATEEKQAAIRKAVSAATEIPAIAQLATLDHVDILTALLLDPAISEPIYTLPKPITQKAVTAFIKQHLNERAEGVGLLMISVDDSDAAAAYHDIQFWPQWSACELGGAIRSDRQGAGSGGGGAAAAFGWLFDVIGIDLICETAALDNHRTARLLERLGFVFHGQIESELPDGGIRPSNYWEMTRADWHAKGAADLS